MFILDLFPSDFFVTHLEVIPEVEHQRFPGVAVYDTTGIPRSPWDGINIPSTSILAYPIPVPPGSGHQIPNNAPYHFERICSRPHQFVLPLATPAQQFNLQLTKDMGSPSEPSIVVRRGSQVMALGRVWVLTIVSCGSKKAHLQYECWSDPIPVKMMTVQDIPRRPEVVGEYHVMRA
jgi:hypothetical protein